MGAALWFEFPVSILSLDYSFSWQVHVHWTRQRERVRIGCRGWCTVPLHDVRKTLLAGSSDDEHSVLCHCDVGKQLHYSAGKTEISTYTRSLDILGTIHTLFLLRLSHTGVSILRSCVLSIIGWLGGTSDILFAETFHPRGCWSCGSLVRSSCCFHLCVTLTMITSPVAYSRFSRHLLRCASTNGHRSPPRPQNSGQSTVPSFPLRTRVNIRTRISKRSFRALLRSEPS